MLKNVKNYVIMGVIILAGVILLCAWRNDTLKLRTEIMAKSFTCNIIDIYTSGREETDIAYVDVIDDGWNKNFSNDNEYTMEVRIRYTNDKYDIIRANFDYDFFTGRVHDTTISYTH